MLSRTTYRLRQLAGLLITASGLWQIASLWFGRLDETVLLTALTGAVYLLIGLGVFGQSRFSLFVAVLVPGAMLLFATTGETIWTATTSLRAGIDALVVLLSARVLWALRHQPSI